MVVRAPRVAVLAVPVLVVRGTVLIVLAGDPVATMIDVLVVTLTPTGLVLRVTTMTVDPDVIPEIHRPPVLDVPTNPGIVAPPVTPTVTMIALAGRLPMVTGDLPVMTTVAHPVPTAEMTDVLLGMVAPARLVRSPVATDVVHVTVALVHLDVTSMTAVEPHGVTMNIVQLVRTAVMIAGRLVTVVRVHLDVSLMIAVVALVVPVRRERVHLVVNTTMQHVIVGVKIVPHSRVHPATNRARVFSVMTLGPVLTATTLVPVLTATTAHVVVVPRTAIAGSARSRQKSKNALMPSGLPSLVVGVA